MEFLVVIAANVGLAFASLTAAHQTVSQAVQIESAVAHICGALNVYSPRRAERLEGLLFESMHSGPIGRWRGPFWLTDPGHMKYERVHGGIGP